LGPAPVLFVQSMPVLYGESLAVPPLIVALHYDACPLLCLCASSLLLQKTLEQKQTKETKLNMAGEEQSNQFIFNHGLH
jgi:hypothetical protein